MSYQDPWKALNLASTTTTVVLTGPGVFHGIVVNKALATGTIAVYDGITAGGTLLATITAPATLLANQYQLIYDIAVSTGICVVTATATQDITIQYRGLV